MTRGWTQQPNGDWHYDTGLKLPHCRHTPGCIYPAGHAAFSAPCRTTDETAELQHLLLQYLLAGIPDH